MIPNEALFIVHVITIAGFTLGALAMGKEALTALICFYSILANLLVTKQMTLFGLNVVCTDVFMIGSIFGLNMLQEHFGKPAAIKAIGINFLIMMCYLGMSVIHLWYAPSPFDTMHEHFFAILAHMPRIIIASIAVHVFVQIVDAQLYGILKKIFGGKYLVGRNLISLSLTQLIDTVLFSFAGLYGIVHSVLTIIVVSYIIKMIVIACNTPFVKLSQYIVKTGKTDE